MAILRFLYVTFLNFHILTKTQAMQIQIAQIKDVFKFGYIGSQNRETQTSQKYAVSAPTNNFVKLSWDCQRKGVSMFAVYRNPHDGEFLSHFTLAADVRGF